MVALFFDDDLPLDTYFTEYVMSIKSKSSRHRKQNTP